MAIKGTGSLPLNTSNGKPANVTSQMLADKSPGSLRVGNIEKQAQMDKKK